MTEPTQMPTLMNFYAGWATYQQGLIEMIEPLSVEQLALPASVHHWSIGKLMQHMIGNRVWWFQNWMGAGDPSLAPIAHWDPADMGDQFSLNASDLIGGLKATWGMIATALEEWSAADLDRTFAPPASMSEEEKNAFGNKTRRWIIWHVLEHEIHHGGEISLALGANGLPGVYGPI